MTVRTATVEDGEEIQGVAERSFRASYSLSPDQISVIVETEFTGDGLAERIEDENTLVLVVEGDDAIRGFAVADLETGTLWWVHVDPTERGDGVGTALVERVESELSDRGKALTALVLDDAAEGDSFIERFGLERNDTKQVQYGNEELSAHVYTADAEDRDANEPAVDVPESVTVDGEDHPVDRESEIPGTDAPFYPTYATADRSERYGFFCSSCGSTDVSADDLDRLECGECGNRHLAEEWDDAYL